MEDRYIFRGIPEERSFSALPEADYNFIVADINRPYHKNDKWILPVKLIIDVPGNPWVFANPWTGMTSAGEERDGIAEFLVACNRIPSVGWEPDWTEIINARGRCHLRVEIAQMGTRQGQEVNKVDYWLRPHPLQAPTTTAPSVTQKPAPTAQVPAPELGRGPDVKSRDPDLDREPDDIPF